jgi:di/tricarboxylate transporter
VTPEAQVVFTILGIATVMFVSGRVRLDVTALLVVLALMLSGVLTVREAVSGFGDPILLILAALFAVGEALIDTGIAYRVGDWLLKAGGDNEPKLIALLMVAAAGLGSVMSSTGVVAIFIPVVLRVASETNRSPARFLIPVSYGALISGMLTLIATPPNLVVNGALADADADVFGLFGFAPIGVGVLVAAVLYMVFVGRRLLGARDHDEERPSRMQVTIDELVDRYDIAHRLHRVLVRADSPLVEKSVAQTEVGSTWRVYVLAVSRQERLMTTVIPVSPDTRLRLGDILLVDASPRDIELFCDQCGLDLLAIQPEHGKRLRETFGVAEVLFPPESPYIGASIKSMELRSNYGVTALAMRRGSENLKGDHTDEPLKPGDILLVAGGWKGLQRLGADPRRLIVLSLPKEVKHAVPMASHAPVAFAILIGMVGMLLLETIPMVATILLAALALVATRCLTMERVYESISWSTLVLVAGLLPVGLALEKTGGMEFIAKALLSSVDGIGVHAALSVVFFVTAGLSMFLSNTATAVLVAPLAVRMALDLGHSPQAFAAMVVMGASAAFVTPISTPVVSLVVAPGNYRFSDFLKVGAPLLVVVWLVSLALTPLVFPL